MADDLVCRVCIIVVGFVPVVLITAIVPISRAATVGGLFHFENGTPTHFFGPRDLSAWRLERYHFRATQIGRVQR